MLCPHCNAHLPEDASICTHCDAILDSSFLDAEDVPTAPRAEAAPLAPPGLPAPPGGGVAPPLEAAAPPAIGAAPGLDIRDTGGKSDGTSILRMDPEQHKETRIVHVSDLSGRHTPAATRAAAAAEEAESGLDDFWGQLALTFRRLSTLEKVALICIGALLLCAFLPWFTRRGEGPISGIETRGWLTALLAALAAVAFWVRITMRIALLVLLQVGLIVGASLVAGHGMLNPGAATSPSFGLYATILAGLAGAVLSLVAAVKT